MIAQAPAFVMPRKPIRSAFEKAQHFLTLKPEQGVAINAREQRECGSAGRSLVREVIVARAIAMPASSGKQDSCFDPVLDCRLAIIGIVWNIQLIGESKRQHKLLSHAARKVDHSIVPIVSIKAPVRRAVRIAVEQGEYLWYLPKRRVSK